MEELIDFDNEELNVPQVEVSTTEQKEERPSKRAKYKKEVLDMDNKDEVTNCLRNERVIVRFIPRPNSKITDPKHVLFGGKAQNSKDRFVVPRLSSTATTL